jgi:hypothetical protein
MNLPFITAKQKQILLLLFKFRFLNTNQFQKLFNHKSPTRIQDWLKDLKEKGYIGTNYSRKSFDTVNKPAVYFLKAKARHILKKEKGCDIKTLEKVYKENKRKEPFINHCLTIADIYLFFIAKKEKDEEISFFTKSNLVGFNYFPENLPDAYIAIKKLDKTRRYFLDVFDPYTPPWVLRERVKEYLTYGTEGNWEASTSNTPIPLVLFVCPTKKLQTHVHFYTKAKLDKQFENKISLYSSTLNNMQKAKSNSEIWQKVE